MEKDRLELERLGEPVPTAELAAMIARLAMPSPALDDEERVDRMRLLESLKAAAAAAQACEMVDFADSQCNAQVAQGVRSDHIGRGVPSQIALALRQSPFKASKMLGTARAWMTDLPETFAALARGETTEYRAGLVAKETACLQPEDRRTADADLGPRLHELGDRATEGEARRWACRLDNAAAARRAAKAAGDRCVSIRPAPDTMTYLTGLLPVQDGVSVYAALNAAAKLAHAQGDTRSRGQIMADTLVARVTGQGEGVTLTRFEIGLVMTDRALLEGSDEPAIITGYGPIPAEVARQWILSLLTDDDGDQDEPDSEASQDRTGISCSSDWRRASRRSRRKRRHDEGVVWLRRLFTSPDSGALVGMDSRARRFAGQLRRLIEYRDQRCTTPFCGAPIRDIDHTDPARRGGATSYANGGGRCQRCNLAKEAPGWSAAVDDGPDRSVTLTTPTGHRYASRPPPVPAEPPRSTAGRRRSEPRESRAG